MTEQPIIPHPTPRTIGDYLPLILVLLVAAWLRMVGAGAFPVSTDEGWTTWAIHEATFGAIVDVVAADRHPPLYFLALGYWSQIAGDSRIALRLPNILIGVLTVALVFRIGGDTFGRTARAGREDVGWYGMLLYGLLPAAVYYTQEIRHFGWFVAAVCVSSLLFLRILRRPRVWLLVVYAISVAATMYLLYFGVWIMVVHLFVGLVLWRGDASINWRVSPRDKGRLIAAWLGAFALYIPWLVVIVQQQWGLLGSGITAQPWSYGSNLGDVLRLLDLLMGGGLALTAGLYVVGLWGSLVSDRTDVTLGLRLANPAWLAELFIVLWGLGLFVLMAIANNFTGVLSARTTIFLSPALMLVVGAGIVRLRIGVRWSLLAGFIGVSLVLPPLIQPRLDYHTAADALAERYRAGDLVVLETGWDDNAFRYEIGLALGDDAEIVRTLPWVNNRDLPIPVIAEIGEQIAAERRVWVVQWHQSPQVMPYLDAGNDDFQRVETIETYVGAQYAGRFAASGAADTVEIALFARPDDGFDPVTFGDTFRARDVVFAEAVMAGDGLDVDVWWSAAKSPELDYSLGVYLLDEAGALVAEANGALLADDPTSGWSPDDRVRYGSYRVMIPAELAAGDYELAMAVYHFESADDPLVVGGADRLRLGSVVVR